MKKWYERTRSWLINQTQIPSDIVLELPRITIIGQIHIYVENHQGLMLFSKDEIHLKAYKGHIQVLGKDFVIKMMYPEEILLEGTIHTVNFVQDENEG